MRNEPGWPLRGRPAAIRINVTGSAHYGDDIVAVRRGAADYIVLPKVESRHQVHDAAQLTEKPVLAMIETAAGVLAAPDIARDAAGLIVGTNDLAADLGIPGGAGRTGLSYALQAVGLASQPVEMLYNDGAVILGLVYGGLLFMIVPLANALESLEPSVVEAGYDLGGSRWTVLRRIVIPHAAPGIAAGSIVVFMLCLGNYLTPTLLGGKNSLWFTEQIYTQFITRFNWNQGAAFGFLLLFLSTLLVWAGLKLTGQRFGAVMKT